MNRISLSILIALLIPLHALSQQKIVTYRTPVELPATDPLGDVRDGGRANTIAIGLPWEMFVASDGGGLFHTIDWGESWKHVDSLPVSLTQSVAYVNSTTLLVSAKADFKKVNGGCIWRSENLGETWTQKPLVGPDPTKRLSAYEISVQGNYVAVGTSDGVFFSRDGGVSFTYTNPYSTPQPPIGPAPWPLYSVLVTGNHILAAGPGGMRVGTITPLTVTWTVPSSPPFGVISSMHAFGRSPVSQLQALVATNTSLWATSTNGMQWGQIPGPAGQPAGICGTPPFIKTGRTGAPDGVVLYYGTGCALFRLPATFDVDTNAFIGQWESLQTERNDRPRDIALYNDDPMLLATNSGIQLSQDNTHWSFAGGGRKGYNAIQAAELKGQYLSSVELTDLYVATRDNQFWAADVDAKIAHRIPQEALYVDVERQLFAETGTRITWFKDNPPETFKAGRNLFPFPPLPWSDPQQSLLKSAPVLIQGDRYIQNVLTGLRVTPNAGTSWDMTPFATFAEDPRGMPKVARVGADGYAIVYQSFKENLMGPPAEGATRLMRIRYSQGNGFVVYPGMTGFGGLGISRTPAAAYPVYGVDSRNAYHVIAPDIINDKMMETCNGGEEWHEIPELTNLITYSGQLLFHTDLEDAEAAPLVTAVSFSPADPKLVLVGTREGGIYMSGDRGKTWSRIVQSEKLPWITSFYWNSANTITLSTYGRGLWKLENRQHVVDFAGFGTLCNGCGVVARDGSRDPKFDASLLAFDGRILGVRTEKGVLREVFVTNGASVVFTGDEKEVQDEIAVTRTNGKDTSEPLPQGPDGTIATGVVFTSDHTFTGAAFAKSTLSLLPPEADGDDKGSTESPVKGRPYIRLIAAAFHGIPAVAPRGAFTLSGTDFTAGESCEVLIDGAPLPDKVTADGKGALTARLTAPAESGYHRVIVRTAAKGTVLDSSDFLVTEEK